jgi:hypothetical protein
MALLGYAATARWSTSVLRSSSFRAPSVLAVIEDVLALDVLHGEVRQAVRGRAPIEQTGDVGMLETGENLTLVAKPLNDGVRVGSALENLDRDALLKHVVGTHRKVDRTHPSAADLADQPVRPIC